VIRATARDAPKKNKEETQMKTFSITMVSLVAMSGLAFAQAAKGSGAAGATVGAGATVKAGAGTGAAGSAAGGAAAGAKAAGGAATGAAGTAAGGAKAAGGAAAGAAGGATVSATAGAKMEMPKPPVEVAAHVKAMGACMMSEVHDDSDMMSCEKMYYEMTCKK
jgi:hypothetical protein